MARTRGRRGDAHGRTYSLHAVLRDINALVAFLSSASGTFWKAGVAVSERRKFRRPDTECFGVPRPCSKRLQTIAGPGPGRTGSAERWLSNLH
jgi:hypothetical protein